MIAANHLAWVTSVGAMLSVVRTDDRDFDPQEEDNVLRIYTPLD